MMSETGEGREKRNACEILAVNLKERDHLDDLAVDRMIKLHCILRKQSGRVWRDSVFFFNHAD